MRFRKEVGPVGEMPPEPVVRAAGLVREGRMVSLAAVRFPGMPLFPGHPPFQVLNYRTPRGIRATGSKPGGPVTDAVLRYMAQHVIATNHSDDHLDADAALPRDHVHYRSGGRTAVWMHPGAMHSFTFSSPQLPQLNPAWLQALLMSASSTTGMTLVDEPDGSAAATV